VNARYTPKNDIWSLGIMLLEFLTGSVVTKDIIESSSFLSTSNNKSEALSMFFSVASSIDVMAFLKKHGYNTNSKVIQVIGTTLQQMIQIAPEKRNSLFDIWNYLSNSYDSLMFPLNYILKPNQNMNVMSDISISYRLIDKKYRQQAILVAKKYISEHHHSTMRLYLPSGVNLFDRFVGKGFLPNLLHLVDLDQKKSYIYCFMACFYITSKILLSSLKLNELVNFLGTTISKFQQTITEIIVQMNFDVYRSSILSWINRQMDPSLRLHTYIETAIEISCNHKEFCSDFSVAMDQFAQFIQDQQESFEQSQNEISFVQFKEYKLGVNFQHTHNHSCSTSAKRSHSNHSNVQHPPKKPCKSNSSQMSELHI
jgi:serine/threonine protein kinase